MKIIRFFLLFSLCQSKFFSQGITSSNTFIQTCIHQTQCFSINNSSYLFYDESKNAFFLKVDFTKFKTGQDTLDDWLNDLASTYLYFKASVDKEVFQSGLANHHIKILKLHGYAFLNGVWHKQNVEMSIFNSDNGLLSTSGNNLNYDSFKVNFSISLVPKDYRIHKKPHHLKKTIFIGITLGRINLLNSNTELIPQEVLDHP